MNKPNIPTNEQLVNEVREARKRLHDVRVSVAEGIANAEELAKAEQDAHFAETRLAAVEEARKARQRKQDQQRIQEIVKELESIDPLIAEAKALEESIAKQVEQLQLKTLEIGAEVAGAYGEVASIRERNKSVITEAGIRFTLSSTVLRIGDKMYAARDVGRVLTDLQIAISNNRIKRPVAQRPARKPKAA